MLFHSLSVAAVLSTLAHALPFTANSTWLTTEWDFIVVGAGPAGIIVADRLSEKGKKTLLIEAGGPSYYRTGGRDRPSWLDDTELSRVDVPGLYKSIFADQGDLTCKNWTNAFGGCTIGGSSAINAGLFFEPPASDFDTYFPDEWLYVDLMEAITKIYERIPSSDVYSSDNKFYLQSGYEAAKKWLVDGAGYRSFNINAIAHEKTKVFGRPVFNYDKGQRGGPATTYLQSALNRTNFRLQPWTRVEKVLRKGSTATGVQVKYKGKAHTVKLAEHGRVVLSGGALQSPALLWFSGIGPQSMRTKLTAAGKLTNSTDWIENAAVGEGLYDNPNTFIELSGPGIESYVHEYEDPDPDDAEAYLEERSGPYSFASETSSFWDYLKMPDGRKIGFQGTIDSSGFGEYTDDDTITLNVYGTSGLYSSGRVVLNDQFLPGPSEDVYYSDPRDADAIATFIRGIFDYLPNSDLTPLNIPINATKEEIRAYITSSTPYTRGQVNHWSSSCRIGTCVDVNTVVKGTKNIHVVDGSIVFPFTVNPQFGIMIAAEHGAEMILGLARSQRRQQAEAWLAAQAQAQAKNQTKSQGKTPA